MEAQSAHLWIPLAKGIDHRRPARFIVQQMGRISDIIISTFTLICFPDLVFSPQITFTLAHLFIYLGLEVIEAAIELADVLGWIHSRAL